MEKEEKRFNEIDKIIFELKNKHSFTYINPINEEEEKKKFFESDVYNPVFKYKKANIDFKREFSRLKRIKYKRTILDKIFQNKAKEIYHMLKIIQDIQKGKNITNSSIKVYKKPDKELVKEALKILRMKNQRSKPSKGEVPPKEILKYFQEVLDSLESGWTVIEKDMASSAAIFPAEKKLAIKKGRSMTEDELKRLLVHEVYTHALRAEFGSKQPYKIFQIGLADYEPTEEGLALYKEKRAGVMDHRTLRKYALRVIAVEKALHSSFRETFNHLLKYEKDKEFVWGITLRVKRGIRNTKRKGALTKDHIYLRGFIEVSRFIKNQSGLHLLHYGKINTKQALLIPSIEGLKNPFVSLKGHFKENIHKLSILY